VFDPVVEPAANTRQVETVAVARLQVEEEGGGGEAWALRTITESPDEIGAAAVPSAAVGVSAERNHGRRGAAAAIAASLEAQRSNSDASFMSEWYWSDDDDETESAHTEETLVEKKEEMIVKGEAAPLKTNKQVWSHKRKPPPVYEP